MANIMYDYNKTRLMYGLRKLAQDQPKEGEEKKPAQAKKPEPGQQPAAPQAAATDNPQQKPSDLATLAGSGARLGTKVIQGAKQKFGPLVSAFTAKPGKKDTPAAPNYKFTQQQWAAARKRRALITAVAGTVGFGTGYLANQLISDDPTLTGGLLTGGVVGALAGGAGYALSDPQKYLKNEADNEFKKNNPGGGGGKDEEKAEDRSWGDRIDDLADWIQEHPWATAIGGGLGIPAFLGTASKLKEQGLDAVIDSLQKVKNLFSRNNGGAAPKPVSKIDAAKAAGKEIDIAVKWLSDPKTKSKGVALYDSLTDAQKKQVDARMGRQSTAPAGNTPGTNGANQGKPGAAPAGVPPGSNGAANTPGNNGAAPAANTPGNNGANQGKPGAAPAGNTLGAAPAGNTSGNNGANQGKPGNKSGYQSRVREDGNKRAPLDQRIAQLRSTGMSGKDMSGILRAEGYTTAQLNDYTYRTIVGNYPPEQAKSIIKNLFVNSGVDHKTAGARAQDIVNAYSTGTSQPTGNNRGGNKGGTPRGGNKGGTPRGGNKGGTPRGGNKGGKPRYGKGGTRGKGYGAPRVTHDSVKGM